MHTSAYTILTRHRGYNFSEGFRSKVDGNSRILRLKMAILVSDLSWKIQDFPSRLSAHAKARPRYFVDGMEDQDLTIHVQ